MKKNFKSFQASRPNVIKKIWELLNKPLGYIEFGLVSNDDLPEEDPELQAEFAEAKEIVRISNFRKHMKRLIKFERDLELSRSGLLITDDEAKERALAAFVDAKKTGKLNDLNQVVEEAVCENK